MFFLWLQALCSSGCFSSQPLVRIRFIRHGCVLTPSGASHKDICYNSIIQVISFRELPEAPQHIDVEQIYCACTCQLLLGKAPRTYRYFGEHIISTTRLCRIEELAETCIAEMLCSFGYRFLAGQLNHACSYAVPNTLETRMQYGQARAKTVAQQRAILCDLFEIW